MSYLIRVIVVGLGVVLTVVTIVMYFNHRMAVLTGLYIGIEWSGYELL